VSRHVIPGSRARRLEVTRSKAGRLRDHAAVCLRQLTTRNRDQKRTLERAVAPKISEEQIFDNNELPSLASFGAYRPVTATALTRIAHDSWPIFLCCGSNRNDLCYYFGITDVLLSSETPLVSRILIICILFYLVKLLTLFTAATFPG